MKEEKIVEQTLVLVKPNGVQRGLIGEVVGRLERRGLSIKAARMLMVSEELAGRHYAEHVGKGFYQDLVDFITSAPVFAMVVGGPSAISVVRTMMGATNPLNAAAGTVRGDFGLDTGQNLVHSSDGPESAEREIGLFFAPEDIVP
jgi:nucleoside-diphosphate kinase